MLNDVPSANTAHQRVADGDLSSVQLGQAGFELVLTGQRSDTVLIDDIRANVLSVEPPADGSYFLLGPQGLDETPRMTFNLAQRERQAFDADSAPFFNDRKISLEKDEKVAVNLIVKAPLPKTYTYEFIVTLDDGRTESVRAPDGSPFVLSGYSFPRGRVFRWTGDGSSDGYATFKALRCSDQEESAAPYCQTGLSADHLSDAVDGMACEEQDLGTLVSKPVMIELTGDGEPEAVVSVTCNPRTSAWPQQVEVFDGKSLASGLTTHMGTVRSPPRLPRTLASIPFQCLEEAVRLCFGEIRTARSHLTAVLTCLSRRYTCGRGQAFSWWIGLLSASSVTA